jgi:hypothetical protein
MTQQQNDPFYKVLLVMVFLILEIKMGALGSQ